MSTETPWPREDNICRESVGAKDQRQYEHIKEAAAKGGRDGAEAPNY